MKEKITMEYVERITEKIILNIFSVGCNPINYEILRNVPSKTNELASKLELTKMPLTKMPLNKRLNDLEKVGLLRRDKKKGELAKTKLTDKFISIVESIKSDVIDELPNIL